MERDKILAYHSWNAFGGIAILDIKYGPDDKVKTGFYHDGKITEKGWNKVYYNASGENYFKKCGNVYYLHDFIVNTEKGGN